MNCNHKVINGDGENYCKHCGDVFDVNMVGVIDRSNNNKYKNLNYY